MKLGGPVLDKFETPDQWIKNLRSLGYRASCCPLPPDAGSALIKSCASAAESAGIVMAEVGAWSNPLSPDESTRKAALETCKKSLALADEIGARCCVNISGSRGAKWDGPCALDLTDETFGMIVDLVRDIIDSAAPKRTFYTLETMPWMFPNSVDSYLELIRAIDRKHFAVHFDPVNLVCSPQIYFRNGDLIRDFIKRLGSRIKSCHAKDIILRDGLTVHLDEARPGTGALDYRAFLSGIHGLGGDIPIMLEHLPGAAEYAAAAVYIRKTASKMGISL